MVAFFLQYLQFQKRKSLHTVRAYQTDLEQFEQFLSGHNGKTIEAAGRPEIRKWIVALGLEKLHPASVNRKLSSLRAFYLFLMREGRIQVNPIQSIGSLKKPKRLPVFVKEKNMENLLDNLEFSPDFSGLRDRLVIELLYGTGMRLSELLGLNWEKVHFPDSRILVFGKRSKERWLPMHKNLVLLLKDYKQLIETSLPGSNVNSLILTDKGKPAYPVFIQRIVKKYLSLVTTEKKKSPHVLRHTFASHLLNAGAEINSIKELLGHSSLAATQVYTHNSVEKLRQVYRQAHPRSGSKPD
jgi:integrase/recombinase XerC